MDSHLDVAMHKMAILWLLLILGLSHAVFSEEEAAAIGGTGGENIGSLTIAELDEFPALSVPGSSAEISNINSTRLSQQSTSSRPDQSTTSRTESTSISTSSSSSSSTSTTRAAPPSPPATPNKAVLIQAVPVSTPVKPSNGPVVVGSAPNLTVPGLIQNAPASDPIPSSALKIPIASSASNTPPVGPANILAPNHTSNDTTVTKQGAERVPIVEEPDLPSTATVLETAAKTSTKSPLLDILSKQQQRSTASSPVGVQASNETIVSVSVPLENTTKGIPVAGGPISAPLTPESVAEQKSIPSMVKSPRVTIVGYTGKPVHTFNLTEKQILYQVRVFWLEPENWRDRGFRPPNRLYDLFCWLSNDGAWVHDMLRQNFSSAIFVHSQWFAFPEAEQEPRANLTVDCGIRAINSGNKPSDWSFSSPQQIHESPVFLRGFDNVNVKGWTADEVTHLIKIGSSENRRDSPDSSSNNARAGENRRC